MNRRLPLLPAAAVLIIGLTACESTTPQSAGQSPTATTSTSNTPTAAAQTPIAVSLEAAAKAKAWYENGGKSRISAIATDTQDIGTAATALNTSELGIACGRLRRHVKEARAYDPLPDQQAQQHWTAALAQYDLAATDCTSAILTNDPAGFRKSGQDLQAGTREIEAATARITDMASR